MAGRNVGLLRSLRVMLKPSAVVVVQECRRLLSRSFRVWLLLLRVMIPVSIAVKVVQELGLLSYISLFFSPLLTLIGLPGSYGIVLVSAMLTGLYGGILALSQVLGDPLSIEQVTVLTMFMLSAHALIVELNIGRLAGLRRRYLFFLRIGFAFFVCSMIHHFCQIFDVFQSRSSAVWTLTSSTGFEDWLIAEICHYFSIGSIVAALIFAMRVLEIVGAMNWVQKRLKPLLSPLGMSDGVAPLVVVGMTLGLAYGGGLIVDEVANGRLSRLDVLMAMSLVSMCHSLIEDTILMVMIGGEFWIIFFMRIFVTLLLTWGLFKLIQKIGANRATRWLMIPNK